MAPVHVGQHAYFVASRFSDGARCASRESGLGFEGEALCIGKLRR